jgi:hypothetical protein
VLSGAALLLLLTLLLGPAGRRHRSRPPAPAVDALRGGVARAGALLSAQAAPALSGRARISSTCLIGARQPEARRACAAAGGLLLLLGHCSRSTWSSPRWAACAAR